VALRPDFTPEQLTALSQTLKADVQAFSCAIADWKQQFPQGYLLLVIDQFEELLTSCQTELSNDPPATTDKKRRGKSPLSQLARPLAKNIN